MTAFLASLALFLALHSVPALPALRGRLIALAGRPVYFAVYSAASLLSLGLVLSAALALEPVALWFPTPALARVTLVTAPLGLFLVTAGLLSRNPLSVTLRADKGPPGAVVALTRHPVLVGFLVWALGHIPPNGDLGAVLLFGSLAAFSAAGIVAQERRARRRLEPQRFARLMAESATVPFAALLAGRARLALDRPLAAALLIAALTTAALLLGLHAALIGVDPLAVALAG